MRPWCVLMAAAVCLTVVPALAQNPPVIRMVVPLPALLPEEQPQKPTERICTTPTIPTGSRVSAPAVCKTVREWNELHARGLDVGADGKVAPLRKSNDVGACGLSCK